MAKTKSPTLLYLCPLIEEESAEAMRYIEDVALHFFESEEEVVDLNPWRKKSEDTVHWGGYPVPTIFVDRFNGSYYSYLHIEYSKYLANIDNHGDITDTTWEDIKTWWDYYLNYDELQDSLLAFGIDNDNKRRAFFLLCLWAKDAAIGQTYDTYVPKEKGGGTTRQQMEQLAKELNTPGKLTFTYMKKGTRKTKHI